MSSAKIQHPISEHGECQRHGHVAVMNSTPTLNLNPTLNAKTKLQQLHTFPSAACVGAKAPDTMTTTIVALTQLQSFIHDEWNRGDIANERTQQRRWFLYGYVTGAVVLGVGLVLGLGSGQEYNVIIPIYIYMFT